MIENLKSYLKNEYNLLNLNQKVEKINEIRRLLHEYSPFKDEPVDFVEWVQSDKVVANEYNPNKVAPPEMELLEVSIMNDGYTQPIVTFPHDDTFEIVDGFHRNRVGKESKIVSRRVRGYLPAVAIRKDKQSKNERIASTIRHNRARGKHQVDAMSEIVLELKNRNWKNARIARELGMDEEEILRLCQITGLQDVFKDGDFSKAWEIGESINDFEPLTDNVEEEVRTVNTSDPNRIFHTYDKWECAKAGFYATKVDGMTHEECEQKYPEILSNQSLFSDTLEKVLKEWAHSCEHYLTNPAMNRIAWLGQAAVCYHSGVPSKYSSGWSLLSEHDQQKANETALRYLNFWLTERGMDAVDMDEAISLGRQVNIY